MSARSAFMAAALATAASEPPLASGSALDSSVAPRRCGRRPRLRLAASADVTAPSDVGRRDFGRAGGGLGGRRAHGALHAPLDLAEGNLLVLEDHQTLDRVLQLADVSRPAVLLKQLPELRAESRCRPLVLPRIARDERFRERRDLVPAFAERGHGQLDDPEAVVEVLAEGAASIIFSRSRLVAVTTRTSTSTRLLLPSLVNSASCST